jgi:hypothetical protein
MGRLVTNEQAAALREILLAYGNAVSAKESTFSSRLAALSLAQLQITQLVEGGET